jgi:glycosyltransferase involved in cell wall biosynthesis
VAHGTDWPTISIITPSLNQGEFLEETLRSVLLQGYPKLQYIVIDGGSTDGSVEIIRRYAPWLFYWVSEPDRGQAHAINKGLELATGRVVAYLNSDDLYLPGALLHVGQTFAQTNFDVFVGTRESPGPWPSSFRRSWIGHSLKPYVFPYVVGVNTRYELPQECVLWNGERYRNLRFDERYHFCLDVEWFARIYSGARVVESSRRIGFYRHHVNSKSSRLRDVATYETARIVKEFSEFIPNVRDEDRRLIEASYVRACRRGVLARLLGLSRQSLFSYVHPAYLDARRTSCRSTV